VNGLRPAEPAFPNIADDHASENMVELMTAEAMS
jgi:hypothetical protein